MADAFLRTNANRSAVSRRSFLGLVGLSAAGFALAGCSDFSSGGSSSSGGEFLWTFWGTGAEKAAVTKVVTSYVTSKKLTPKCESIPQNYETKLNTMIAANTPPDAGYLTEPMSMRLGSQGKIASIVGQPGFEDILPSALHYWAPGKAVSQTAIESLALWYDEKATDTAGVTPPAASTKAWNWDAFVEAADSLTIDNSGKHPSDSGFNASSVKRYGVAAPTALTALIALWKSNGIDLFDNAGTKTNLDSPEAIDVVQKVADLIFQHRVSPTPAQATTFGSTTALLLASGRVAMAIDGTWALIDLGQSSVKYNVSAMPQFQSPYTFVLSGANGVFKTSKHQDVGFGLLGQLADPTKVPLYANGLWMPLLKKYYTDQAAIDSWTKNTIHPSHFRTAVIDGVLGNTVAYPSYKIKNFTTISTTINNGLTPLFTKQTDIPTALKALAANVNKQMQGAYPDTAS